MNIYIQYAYSLSNHIRSSQWAERFYDVSFVHAPSDQTDYRPTGKHRCHGYERYQCEDPNAGKTMTTIGEV